MTRAELAQLELRAKLGEAEAQYRAGCIRHDGEDASLRSVDRAVRWLRRAAMQGHAPAARRLGYIYVVDEKDVIEGIRWYAVAAEQGDGPAAFSLGHLLSDRDRRPTFYDPAAAIRAFERALAAGEARASLGLGLMLLTPDVPGHDPWRGAQLVSEASSVGFIHAFHVLRNEASRGRIVRTIASESPAPGADPFPFRPARIRLVVDVDRDTLQRRASADDAGAMHDLGVLVWFDDAPRHARPPLGDGRAVATAYVHYEAAAKRGIPDAQFALGCIAMTEVGYRSTRVAIGMFEAAAEHGHVDAHRALEWIDRNLRLHVTVVSG